MIEWADLSKSIDESIDSMRTATREIQALRLQVAYLARFHPDFSTPSWCWECTPSGIGYCRCKRASNE